MMGCVKCGGCDLVMPRGDWEGHKCPAIPKTRDDESPSDYMKRCDIFMANWRREKGLDDNH